MLRRWARRYSPRVIDFSHRAFHNLGPTDADALPAGLQPQLLPDEVLVLAFDNARDAVVFTNKRVICISVEGLAGRKKHHASVPLCRVAAWSVVTLGSVQDESGLDVWLDGFGQLRLEFRAGVDVLAVGQQLAGHLL